MRNIIFSTLIAISMCVFSQATPVHAVEASNLSIRLEEPKTPTNQNSFGIVFVALDLAKRDVTVTCQKQGPSDGGLVTFGSPQTFTNGGNTGTCAVDSSILSVAGTYKFQTTATADSETQPSNEVTVVYNTEGPGDPRDYSKSKPSACEYKIHFKTADDAGKTVKVEIYRSENTSFSADAGTRVSTVNVGSNTERDETISGTCDKTYYFAVRAFDAGGNGSNIVGDSETHVTITLRSATTTSTTTTGGVTTTETGIGAVEVPEGAGLSVEGETVPTEEGTALGEATGTAEVITLPEEGQVKGAKTSIFTKPVIVLLCGILLGTAFAIWYANRKKIQEASKQSKRK